MTEEEMATLITRRFIWDMHGCAYVPEVLSQMGMVVGSQEVLDREHAERHLREAILFPLEEQINSLSGLAAEVISRTILGRQAADADDLDGDELPYLIEAATRAVVSYLISCRVLRF